MGVDESVADENAVLFGYEDFFLGENHASHAVGHAWHALAVELADVLVAGGRHDAAPVAVQAEVEFRAMLNHGFVKARQQDIVLVVLLGDGYHQQAVLLAGVASWQR